MTRQSFSKFASLIGSGAILMPEGVSSGRLRAETPSGDAEALRTLKTVMRWTSIIMETSGPGVDEVRMLLSWLGDCKISKADHDGSFHDTYSNACAFSSSTFMTLRSRFGYQFGIDRQPWAFALGHQSKASELNNLEMEALIAMFQNQGSGEYVPYPDSPRMEPTSTHQEPFNRFLASQGAKSGDTKLVYARWFLGSQQRSKTTALPGVRLQAKERKQPADDRRPACGRHRSGRPLNKGGMLCGLGKRRYCPYRAVN